MRVRPCTSSLAAPRAALVALLGVGVACADAPSAPPALAPRVPAADVAPTPGDVVVGGRTFANVPARPGGWMETFNVYYFPDNIVPSPWTRTPAPWVPERMTAADEIASNFTAPNDWTRAPNSLAEWSIVRQMRDPARWYAPEAMAAWHDGVTCAAPPAMHTVASYDESPFLCRDHMMTAVNASGYGVTYLTPNRLVDLSSGEAVVRFDVATLRASSRDWIDLWITPYADNLVVPLEDSLPDVQGYPRNAFHVRMTGGKTQTRFAAELVYAHRAYRVAPATTATYESAFAAFTPGPGEPAHSGAPSATRRDTFELRLSGGRLRFGMPRYGLWWIDTPVGRLGEAAGAAALGVVQIGHHSFAPATDGGPDTWHWDNIGMAPAVRFSIVNADRRYVDQSTTAEVVLARPAPAEAMLRFAGYGSRFEVRFDGGKWQRATRQSERLEVGGRFHSYWTPAPEGITRVEFRAENDPLERKGPTRWMARDVSVWSLNP